MIYLIMCGRLGNQLFQYSFARKIQEETGQQLSIDFTAINNVHKESWINYLDNYNVTNYNIVNNKQYYPIQRYIYRILKFFRPKSSEKLQFLFDEITSNIFSRFGIIYYESNYIFHDFKKIHAKNIIIRGWFESAKYFDSISDKLKFELIPKNVPLDVEKFGNFLLNNHSICLTVRRGNFLNNNLKEKFLVCTIEYYNKAIELIKEKFPNSIIYICSDDIEWCKKNLKFNGKVIFETEKNVTLKLYLMSKCTDFVLSNSTFSWWSQFLSFNKNNIVIAPSIWRKVKLKPKDIYSDNWILLDEFGNKVN